MQSNTPADENSICGTERFEPVPVSLEIVWEGSSGKYDARMSEISMEGCFIDSRAHGSVLGDIVNFKARIPNGPWASLQGELVYEDYPMGFGLSFRGLTDSDKRLLAQVVVAHGGYAGELEPPPEVIEKQTSMRVIDERRSVLVADDDALTLLMVSAIAETEGYRVVTATDGQQAHRLLQQDVTFSAAIFDMMMPHMPGLDLILYMKSDMRLRHIPVGMITAQADPKVWNDSVAAGACVFLPKPFTPPQVQMMLRMLAKKADY